MYRPVILGEEIKKLFLQPNYIRKAWKEYVDILKQYGYRYPKENTFRLEIFMAIKLGLLDVAYKRKPAKGNFPITYYQVVPEKINDKAWNSIVGYYKKMLKQKKKHINTSSNNTQQ